MKTAFILPLIVFLAAAPMAAQATEEIRGRILPAPGEQGLPENMMLTIRSTRGHYVQTLPVHTSGQFAFAGVPATSGEYILELRCPGRQLVTETIRVAGGSQSGTGQISSATAPFVTLTAGRLLESADQANPAAGQAVSAEWLKIPPKARQELTAAEQKSAAGEHDDAIEHLKKALQIAPDLYHAYNNLAVEYLALEKPKDAIAALRESIKLRPDIVSTHRNLGVIYLDAGDVGTALQHLETARDVDEGDFETLMLLGEAYYGQERLAEALQSFETATRVSPDSAEGYLSVGQCHLRLAHYREAVEGFEKFLKLSGDGDERTAQVRNLVVQLKNRMD